MGGVRVGDQRFCNRKCHQNAHILNLAQNIPGDVLERKIEEVWRGNCPKCRGLGPIDVHRVHQVWSMLVLTRWTSTAQISCRSCGVKSQLGGAVFSLFCGWWGFPWGLILTPVQITRNVIGMSSGPDPSRASDNLRKMVLISLGTQMLAAQKNQPGSPAKPGPPPPLKR